MRIRISHRTTYVYKTPAKSIIQILRLTPRSHDGQRVGSWRIDMDADHALRMSEDAFGNIIHTTNIAGPLTRLSVTIDGDVETFDTAGILRGSTERFPPELYLRSTSLTEADAEVRDFASATLARGSSPLDSMHQLMGEISDRITFDSSSTQSETTAVEAYHLKRGVCQDFAHLFIACARHGGVPARYVGGYFLHVDGKAEQDAGHAWAEAYVDGLGWIGFDQANCICPHECHVSVARGLDYQGAAPVRGAKSGGDGEELSVAISVSQQQDQRQS